MIPTVVYNSFSAEEDVYPFTAVVEWEDDVNEIPEMLNATVNTTLKGPDLDITVLDTYSDGMCSNGITKSSVKCDLEFIPINIKLYKSKLSSYIIVCILVMKTSNEKELQFKIVTLFLHTFNEIVLFWT